MLQSWKIGDFRVWSIVEYYGPTHDPEFLFPEFDRAKFQAAAAQFPPGHYYPAIDRLVVTIQTWLLEAGDRRILIDTGVGNMKTREAARMLRLNTLWPAWFAATGQDFGTITDVVMTHMHSDHVGWNTVPDGERWVPTFPNARYHFPQTDYDYFKARREAGNPVDAGSFADSVAPIVEAGLANFITDQTSICDCLRVAAATGHTPGQLNYWIESGGETGVFSADIMHHIVQIYRPEWNTAFCILPDEAKSTRAAFLAEAARTGAMVMPCHFGPPHTGFIRKQADGFAFEPAPNHYGVTP